MKPTLNPKPLLLHFSTQILALGILLSLALFASEARSETRLLGRGHTDLALGYDATSNAWRLDVGSDLLGVHFLPDEVVLKVRAAARTTVPPEPKLSFLGAPGTAVWILPQSQTESLLYLGFGGEALPGGVFVGNQVQVALKEIIGPGAMLAYSVDGFGVPRVQFNSRDGVDASDVAFVQAGSDTHLNWAFTQPGEYTLVLEASGQLLKGGTTTRSGPVAFRFTVGSGPDVVQEGHTDLAIQFSEVENTWNVYVGSDAGGQSYDPDDVLLRVKAEAKTVVPSGGKFAFLGAEGAPVWVLPETKNPSLLYLGYGGEGIPDGVFVSNQVKVTLKAVQGPGALSVYTTDPFGNPRVLFNTQDGIGPEDNLIVRAGRDAHLSWAFSQPGDYSVQVEISGTLVDGGRLVSSGLVTYRFSVLQPIVFLESEHADLRVKYDENAIDPLALVLRDNEHHVDYSGLECVLVAKEASQLELPAGTPFGNEGDPIYVLPQSQNPDLLYLGVSTEGVPSGVFNGELRIRLTGAKGPGNFFLWQASSFGDFVVKMNSADGIGSADEVISSIGTHEHYNWGFTAPGRYQLTFQVSGNRSDQSQPMVSPEMTFVFHVLPIPATPPSLRVLSVTETGAIEVEVTGDPGATYDLVTSEDLGRWQPWGSVQLIGSTTRLTVPLEGPRRFLKATPH